MEAAQAFVTQLQPGTGLCVLQGCSCSAKSSREQEPRSSPVTVLADGTQGLTQKQLQPMHTPAFLSFFFYSRKLCSSKKPGCPKLCTPRGCRAVQRRAGKSHKAAVEPSHRKSLLKQREELQKANSVSSEKKLILCSCLNKLYSFPSGTFIPVYSTTSEMV